MDFCFLLLNIVHIHFQELQYTPGHARLVGLVCNVTTQRRNIRNVFTANLRNSWGKKNEGYSNLKWIRVIRLESVNPGVFGERGRAKSIHFIAWTFKPKMCELSEEKNGKCSKQWCEVWVWNHISYKSDIQYKIHNIAHGEMNVMRYRAFTLLRYMIIVDVFAIII